MRRIKNSSGFSLIEILIALAISGLLLVGAINLLVSSTVQSSRFIQNLDSEMDQTQASTLLRTVFGHAIELKYAGNANLNNYNGSLEGQVREFDSNTYWLTQPQTHTLAIFWREARMSTPNSPATLTSQIRRTGIFFQTPTRTTWGRLYIVANSDSITVEPRTDSPFFEGLVRARIRNVNVYREDSSAPVIQAPVTSLDLELTFRQFLGDSSEIVRNYCPSEFFASDADCARIGAHRDVVRTYKFIIKNNVVSTSLSGTRGARLYDQIQFFVPNRSASFK